MFGQTAVNDNQNVTTFVQVTANAFYDYHVIRDTIDPTVSLREGETTAQGTFGDGEVTNWVSTTLIEGGQNTFHHSIAGANTAEFQFRYTYVTNDAIPTPIELDATTATIADGTIVATPTAITAEASPALVDLPGTPTSWTLELFTADGAREFFDVSAVLSVDIKPEHTAAWGATVTLPPIIELSNYRDGKFRLWYAGKLQLRCPEITERQQDSDGVLTIGGIGPVSELKSHPVDRTFDDVLGTDAIRTVLIEDAGLSRSQINVHDVPDNLVENEIARQATTRDGFDDALLKRSRTESGQFASEAGGSAPNWQPTDPFTFAYEGGQFKGVRTTQTLHFFEAEGWDAASGATATSAAGASGGSVVGFGDTDATTTTYRLAFDHEVPEGSLSLSLRAQTASASGSGTTTIRVRADDHELISFPASDFDGSFSWKHIDTDYVAGTESIGLRVDITSAGDTRLDIDCLALYDSRYEYTFDNSASGGALSGPELYPDAAALSFQSVPVGLALDSATASVTFDVGGENDMVGIEATGGGGSSGESVTGVSDSHTAAFAATTSGVRPLVSLSRASESRTETPTEGTRPQILTAVTTTISGNAIPVIDNREFSATDAFNTLQTLCNDYGLYFTVEHGNERGELFIEVFQRGDERLRRELPPDVAILSEAESAAVNSYANVVTVIGDEQPDGTRVSWTERAKAEIDAFGVERAPPIENDELDTINDCRAVARAELAKRLDEDERGGKMDITPRIVEPGYPIHIPLWEDPPASTLPGWGESWGEVWGGGQPIYATPESSSFGESSGDASASLDFSIRSDMLAVLAGGI